mgnify:CR=1 FL=1
MIEPWERADRAPIFYQAFTDFALVEKVENTLLMNFQYYSAEFYS